MTNSEADITEETTLAELREQRLLLGVVALHVYLCVDDVALLTVRVHHATGFYEGSGPTEATAIEAAFTKLRRALLPEPLKQYLAEIEKLPEDP